MKRLLESMTKEEIEERVVKPLEYPVKISYTSIKCEGDEHVRFVLRNTKPNPLFFLCINPSTADESKSDRTISKIMGFAGRNGHEGFVVLNLYPQRCTDPNSLPGIPNKQLIELNLRKIHDVISHFSDEKQTIVAAWGSTIVIRPWLKDCLRDIVEVLHPFSPNWKQIGEVTINGHPRHPSRAPYRFQLQKFDIENYLNQLSS